MNNFATMDGTLILSRPAGPSCEPLTSSRAPARSDSIGDSLSSNRWPASVGVTLRVVRLSSRVPSLASSRRTASLSAEAETPRNVAAPR